MGLFDKIFGKKEKSQEVKKNKSNSSKKDFYPIVDEYAHYLDLSGEKSNPELENKLLAGGPDVADVIVDYLIQCGMGSPSIESYWWNNAESLVRLIKEFSDVDYESKYKKLINVNTNIWEYHREVKEIAEDELRLLKEKDSKSSNAGASTNSNNNCPKELFEKVIKTTDLTEGKELISKIDSQDCLKQIANTECEPIIRGYAIEKIEDKDFLKEFCLEISDEGYGCKTIKMPKKIRNDYAFIARKACNMISDEDELKDIAKNGKHYSAREAAVERIDDEDFLIDIIENDCNKSVVIKVAFRKLQKMESVSDKTLKKIKEMANNHEDYNTRLFANAFLKNEMMRY